MILPSDPLMLLSVINTRLRDKYDSLEDLIQDLDLSEYEISVPLEAIGYEYDSMVNQFVKGRRAL